MIYLIKKLISKNTVQKIRSLRPSFFDKKHSFSQCGEDLIVIFLLNLISNNKKINYLDIGANHPFYLSNTALLYKYGGSGTLVEPDPYFAKLIRRRRSKDKVLECGVHFSGDQTADFYIMDTPSLNTFSKTEMQRYEQMGHKLKKTIEVNLMNINDILQSVGELDFVNLDIEGLDFEIIKMINWEKYRPKCICVETLNYEKTKEPVKSNHIIDYMISKNYILYADTFINSIFVDKQTWEQHWSSIKSL